jgi:hypothetical protein
VRTEMAIALAASLVFSQVVRADPRCSDGVPLPDHSGKRIVLVQDALLFATDNIQLDIDGAPSAYGVRDQGLEDICNGLGPLQPPECRGKNRGDCYRACRTAFASWDGSLQTLDTKMCSIGLGGGGCSKPDVALQDAPRQAWFVSETTVRVAPPEGISIPAWTRTQPAQLDSTAIPYFVIPNGFRHMPWDGTPGDAGVIIDQRSGRQVTFIVGDVGGSLNEGSARLLANLRNVDQLPTARKTSAFGDAVERLEGSLDGDFRVAIFRHTAPLLPRDRRGEVSVLDKSAGEITEWIATVVRDRLHAIGDSAHVVACTKP